MPRTMRSAAGRPGIDEGCDDDPQRPAVKGHAALPDLKDQCRVRKVVAWLIEKDVAQPAPEDDAKDHPEQQVLELLRRHHGPFPRPEPGCPDRAHHQPPAQHDAHDIGQGVPAQRQVKAENRDREDLGIDIGKGKRTGHGPIERALRGKSTLPAQPFDTI